MVENPKWLLRSAVLAMHARQLAEHGGGEGIRDEGMLDSALQRPENKHAYGEPDIHELAAAYAYGIAKNHPFIDGNKRTSLVASFTFLTYNSYEIRTAQAENAAIFLALAAGELAEDELAAWFRKNAFASQ